MSTEQLLTMLLQADGPLSGEQISRELGVSRAAVWKQMEALRAQGYAIASAPRRGYRLEQAPDVLHPGELRSRLTDCALGGELVCLPTVDSTNTECKRRFLTGSSEGLVVLADEQTGGRGRVGRSFLSLPGKGLYLSVLLQPRLQPMEAVNLTAWAAVAVCDAVEEVCGVRPGIKWTNDLILNGKKLGGILTEMELEAETGALRWIICGIGINCGHGPEDFPEELRPVATSLAMALGHPVRRAELAAALVRALDRMYRRFPHDGLADYLAAYRRDCVTVGRQVQLLGRGEPQQAFAEAITEDFALAVRYPDGERAVVNAGEVSVRGICGYADTE